jgi:hypothetical protein
MYLCRAAFASEVPLRLPCCCVAALQIVQRMFCVTFPAGSTILLQNAQPSADDCMYYLAQGQAEVVIMGTVDAASKQGPEGTACVLTQCSCVDTAIVC